MRTFQYQDHHYQLHWQRTQQSLNNDQDQRFLSNIFVFIEFIILMTFFFVF